MGDGEMFGLTNGCRMQNVDPLQLSRPNELNILIFLLHSIFSCGGRDVFGGTCHPPCYCKINYHKVKFVDSRLGEGVLMGEGYIFGIKMVARRKKLLSFGHPRSPSRPTGRMN